MSLLLAMPASCMLLSGSLSGLCPARPCSSMVALWMFKPCCCPHAPLPPPPPTSHTPHHPGCTALNSEQKALLDFLVLAQSAKFAGFGSSTFSFYLREYRALYVSVVQAGGEQHALCPACVWPVLQSGCAEGLLRGPLRAPTVCAQCIWCVVILHFD